MDPSAPAVATAEVVDLLLHQMVTAMDFGEVTGRATPGQWRPINFKGDIATRPTALLAGQALQVLEATLGAQAPTTAMADQAVQAFLAPVAEEPQVMPTQLMTATPVPLEMARVDDLVPK